MARWYKKDIITYRNGRGSPIKRSVTIIVRNYRKALRRSYEVLMAWKTGRIHITFGNYDLKAGTHTYDFSVVRGIIKIYLMDAKNRSINEIRAHYWF